MKARIIFFAVALLISVAVAVVATMGKGRRRRKLLECGTVTSGRVISISKRGSTDIGSSDERSANEWVVEYSFLDAVGVEHVAKDTVPNAVGRTLTIGGEIKVCYGADADSVAVF